MFDTETARRYQRRRIAIRIATLLVLLAYAVVLGLLAPRVSSWLAGVTTSRWLGLYLFGAAFFLGFELLTLPVGYYAVFHVEHAFGLSNQTRRGWLIHTAKECLVGMVVGGILVGMLYGALWHGGRLWWLWVWIGWLGLSVGLAKLFPVLILPLFYSAEALDQPPLLERIGQLARDTGLTIKGVFKLGLSIETKKANAMLAGMGATRRVYLSDTLLDAFDHNEIAVVFAHELGHHIHRHIVKGIVLSAVLSTLTILAVAVVLSPCASPHAPWTDAVAALPRVVLAVALLSFALSPLANAVSRRFERQSDWEAIERTRDPAAFRSTMEKLGRMNLADPKPARWIEVLFHDHPALAKRIAMADRWEVAARDRGAAGGPVA